MTGNSDAGGGDVAAWDILLRGSREATLGADGLRISRAGDATPARSQDDSRPPVYADDPSVAAPQEGDAAREAVLGGPSSNTRPASGLAPEDESLARGAGPGDPDPERDSSEEAGSKKST